MHRGKPYLLATPAASLCFVDLCFVDLCFVNLCFDNSCCCDSGFERRLQPEAG